jgi:hypothetical protein
MSEVQGIMKVLLIGVIYSRVAYDLTSCNLVVTVVIYFRMHPTFTSIRNFSAVKMKCENESVVYEWNTCIISFSKSIRLVAI